MTRGSTSPPSPGEPRFPVVHRRAAGIDIGSTFHVVAVPSGLDERAVRTFGTFTGELRDLAEWLLSMGITTVAMESTSVYWIPVFEILQERGLEVLLVNARFAKNVPGRKTDVNDAQWLQQLHAHGLLRGSFRPSDEVVPLRAYLRQRERLVQYRASHVQHMQKALMQMNVQLHHVVTDVTGVTGMKIIHAIIAGERNPDVLARLRDSRCKASVETISAALDGNYRPEHVFALQQSAELYDFYTNKIAACDAQLEQRLRRLNEELPLPEEPLPPPRSMARSKNRLAFDARSALYLWLGVDLTQIHGIGPHIAMQLVAECGTDMSKWPTAKYFTSWLTLAPASKISGGKVLSTGTRRSKNRAAGLFRMAAMAVGRTDTALGAFYRRLGARAGKAKAITATARKIAVLFYNSLRHGVRYTDPGADYYDQQHQQRVLRNLQRRARKMGYALVPTAETVEGVS
jgi:transposase